MKLAETCNGVILNYNTNQQADFDMPFPYTTRPFKARSRRGIPAYVAVLAMVLLAFTLPSDFGLQSHETERAKVNRPAAMDEPASQVERKINIRLSLFRHG
jgi:hypothetical protein